MEKSKTIAVPRWMVVTGGALLLGGGAVLALGTILGGVVLKSTMQKVAEENYRQGVIRGMESCSVYVEGVSGSAGEANSGQVTGQLAAGQEPESLPGEFEDVLDLSTPEGLAEFRRIKESKA